MTRPLLAVVLALLAALPAVIQPAQGELQDLVNQAAARRDEYIGRFRDLTAVETWVTEILRPNGTVDRRRTVISDFFVYQSRLDSAVRREYRIPREVDGKAAGDPVGQATKLFRALATARTLKEEDAALFEQNIRHVLRFVAWGHMVDPFWAVAEEHRKDFQFAVTGRDRVGDDEVIALKYESKTFEAREAHHLQFKNPRTRFQGTVWLTTKNERLRRWVDEQMIVDDEITLPEVLLRRDITYQPSPVGVVPTRIDISKFDKVRQKKSPPSVRLSIRQTFAYQAFKRFDVSTATEIKKSERH